MGISNPKLKSMGMAFGASAIAAIGTMFLPVALLESLTGATGLSELVPATAAPLGDTARALIAFGTGAFTLALMAIILLRKDRDAADLKAATVAPMHPEAESASSASVFLDGLKQRLMNFKVPQMPWAKKSDDDILDLADLPKLRTMDSHPDAPARRPFSAGSDLDVATPQTAPSDLRFWPERSDTDVDNSRVEEPAATVAASESFDEWSTVAQEVPAPLAAPEFAAETRVPQTASESRRETIVAPSLARPAVATSPIEAEVAAPIQSEPSLDDLVNKLQRAVAQRQQQLIALEMVATQIKSEAAAVAPNVIADFAPVAEQPALQEEPVVISEPVVTEPVAAEPVTVVRSERPTLEAVPTSQRRMADEDMDAALNAALETLQRMNVQGR